MFWKKKKDSALYNSVDVLHKKFLNDIETQLQEKGKEFNKRISQFSGTSHIGKCRVVDFRQMYRVMITLLNEALVCVDEPYQKENIERILHICSELFTLWGIGYQVLSRAEEESLERIVDMIDTLKQDSYESPFE